MASTGSGEREGEMQQVLKKDGPSSSMKLKDFIPLDIAGEKSHLGQAPKKKRFLDFLKAHPPRDWYLKLGFVGRLSPYSFLKRNGSQANGPSPSDAPLGGSASRRRRRPFRVPFVRKIDWPALMRYFKNWAKHPMNMALLVWLFFVVSGIVMLALLMTGLLNGVITDTGIRKRWTEIMNQILNALFTIMCLYQHPKLFHHIAVLWRWTPKDVAEARAAYCKDGARRPHERARIAFVLFLLHVTCFSQYLLCGLYWGFTSNTRPDWATYLCMALGTISPIVAALYAFYSPLGRKFESEIDEESQREGSTAAKPAANELRNYSKRVVVTKPDWAGGLFDCWDDLTVAYLSFFCTFCVFGWNMERLGFGNMYVHIITFLLLCIAPFWVFNVSALNIHDDTVRYMVGITGIVLCFFGLFYGGFWRIQMRKKFKLPANPFCCGFPVVTDFMQWLFCWSCSLAQEVRTVNFYDIEEDSFCQREAAEVEESQRPVLAPLPREGGAGPLIKPSSFEPSVPNPPSPAKSGEDPIMTPPLPPLIPTENTQQPKS